MLLSMRGSWSERDRGCNQLLSKKYYMCPCAPSAAALRGPWRRPVQMRPWSLNSFTRIHLCSPFCPHSLRQRSKPNWDSVFCNRKDTGLGPRELELSSQLLQPLCSFGPPSGIYSYYLLSVGPSLSVTGSGKSAFQLWEHLRKGNHINASYEHLNPYYLFPPVDAAIFITHSDVI